MHSYWISWYHAPNFSAFELRSPWWISGERAADNAQSICAAIKANNEKEAHEMIYKCYDLPPNKIEFRFCEIKHNDWSPFGDRFPKSSWMDSVLEMKNA